MKISMGWMLSVAGMAACSNNAWESVGGPPTGQPVTPIYGSASSSTEVAPISGGTLTVLSNGNTAVAADSDRDTVWIADLGTQTVTGSVTLRPGDEPGRVVEAMPGTVFVSLRRAGAVAKIDTSGSGSVVGRYSVCPAPRGLAYDGTNVHVACADGNLVSLDPASGAVTRWITLDNDLRDVVALPNNSGLAVTTFRSATLIQLDSTGTVTSRTPLVSGQSPFFGGGPGELSAPPPEQGGVGSEPAMAGGGTTTPNGVAVPTVVATVAYRMVAANGSLFIVHQNARNDVINVQPESTTVTPGGPVGVAIPTPATTIDNGSDGYGSPGTACDGSSAIVTSGMQTVTVDPNGGSPTMADSFVPQAVLPVDVAVSSDMTRQIVVAAGNASLPGVPQLVDATQPCGATTATQDQPNGQIVAAAFDSQNRLLAQTRQPAAIYLVDQHAVIPLPGAAMADTGHEIFYSDTGGGIACASCHAEGGDDGHVWNFSDVGLRRTMNLRGVQIGNGPFHWGGELQHFSDIVSVVFEQRMFGPNLTGDQATALQHFIHGIQPPVAPMASDTSAVARGQALFNDTSVGCTSCHSGSRMTNDAIVNVGTGGMFKVPSLVGVASRAPYMHDGCAATLTDRFGTCGGGDLHGHTSQLSTGQVGDLVAYLATL